MKKLIGLLILAFISSCYIKQTTKDIIVSGKYAQLGEVFIDSLNIGRKSYNKIELSMYQTNDSVYVVINFYSKHNRKWVLRDEYEFQKDALTGLDTKLSDFNNDGLNDMTYISNIAARSANEIRRLFIYNKKTDHLISIKNSENYPNMFYNKELNCIDALLIYGGSSTVFLKINADSLKEFASINVFDSTLQVKTYDEFDNEKVIYKDTTYQGGIDERFKNFNPLKKYEPHEYDDPNVQ